MIDLEKYGFEISSKVGPTDAELNPIEIVYAAMRKAVGSKFKIKRGKRLNVSDLKVGRNLIGSVKVKDDLVVALHIQLDAFKLTEQKTEVHADQSRRALTKPQIKTSYQNDLQVLRPSTTLNFFFSFYSSESSDFEVAPKTPLWGAARVNSIHVKRLLLSDSKAIAESANQFADVCVAVSKMKETMKVGNLVLDRFGLGYCIKTNHNVVDVCVSEFLSVKAGLLSNVRSHDEIHGCFTIDMSQHSSLAEAIDSLVSGSWKDVFFTFAKNTMMHKQQARDKAHDALELLKLASHLDMIDNDGSSKQLLLNAPKRTGR